MICRMCHEDRSLVKSHIIPQAFFVAINGDVTNPSKLITNDPGKYPKRSPVGVYDENILCASCENIFGGWDDYAISVFRDESIPYRPVNASGRVQGYLIDPDYARLKLYFLSLLWRAGVSKQDYYSKVQLGPHEENLRAMLLARKPGGVDDYSVFMSVFNANPEEVAMVEPWKKDIEDVCHYHFVFYGFHAAIKVASHSVRGEKKHLLLSPNASSFILLKPYRGSDYYKLAAKIASAQRVKVF